MYDISNELDSLEKLHVHYCIKREQFIEKYEAKVRNKLWYKIGKLLNLINEDKVKDWVRQYLMTVPGSLKEVDGICVLDYIRSINTTQTWIAAIVGKHNFTITEYDYRWFIGAKAHLGKDIFKDRYVQRDVDSKAIKILASIDTFDKYMVLSHKQIDPYEWYELFKYKANGRVYEDHYDQYVNQFENLADDEVLISVINDEEVKRYSGLADTKQLILAELEEKGLKRVRELSEGDVWVFKLTETTKD